MWLFSTGCYHVDCRLELASGIGAKGTYVSMPTVSRFWMYLPVPLAGIAMIIFEIEALYNHIRSFYVKEEK